MAKTYLAKVEIIEIDAANGTGRDKDDRTLHVELANFAVRDADLEELKDKIQKHVDLV